MKVKASVIQKLKFTKSIEISLCPDEEFKDTKCLKIGDEYFLPSIEWTKFIPASLSDDGYAYFEEVTGEEWEAIHHAIKEEKTKVTK